MSDHSATLARDRSCPVTSHLRPFLGPLKLQKEHGGDTFAWARRLGVEAMEILDFSSSVNPLGPPPGAREAFSKSYGEISHYPDLDGLELREALARHHGLEPGEVLPGNGSAQLIYLLCRALRPRRALVVHPAFCEYANALKLVGSDTQSHMLKARDEFRFGLEKFKADLSKGFDAVFVANPNSVTAQIIPRAEMEEMAGLALKRRFFLVIDEAFIDFVEEESAERLLRENPYLIIVRSLTKYYGIPGLRIGYLLAHQRIVNLVELHQEPWSINVPAERVALACLKHESFKSKTNRWLKRERKFLLDGLDRIPGFRPYPSRVNFILIRYDSGELSELRAFLLGKKILVRSCDSFLGVGSNFFRIAVRGRKENSQLLNALEEFMSSRPRVR